MIRYLIIWLSIFSVLVCCENRKDKEKKKEDSIRCLLLVSLSSINNDTGAAALTTICRGKQDKDY